MKKTTTLVIIVLLALAALIFFLCCYYGSPKQVSNFEECTAAGNPVMESYPRQCRHDGQLFVEKIVTPAKTPETVTNPPAAQGKIAAQAAAVRTQVASKLGVSDESITIISMEKMDWPNGCLGLAGLDEMCTQVITPGYEITAQVDGKNYIYRTNVDGSVVREGN